MPGIANGAGGGVATLRYDPQTRLTPLTVNLGEFAQQINAENRELLQFGWFFQWNTRTRREHNVPSGPVNPQALNRYAYVLNNPLRYVDPTGHGQITEGTFTIDQLKNLKTLIEDMKTAMKYAGHILAGGSILLGASTGLGVELGLLAAAVWEVEIHFETSQLGSLSNFIGRVIETAEKRGVETVTISTSYDPFFTCEDWWSGIGVTISATDGQRRSLYDRWVLTGMTGLYVPLLISNPEQLATLLKKLHSTAVTWE